MNKQCKLHGQWFTDELHVYRTLRCLCNYNAIIIILEIFYEIISYRKFPRKCTLERISANFHQPLQGTVSLANKLQQKINITKEKKSTNIVFFDVHIRYSLRPLRVLYVEKSIKTRITTIKRRRRILFVGDQNLNF